MLTALRIQNFITIKDFESDFFDGLTIFTGESGSGKSVIFTALYCLLGKPFPESLIRAGAERAECEAVFSIKQYNNEFLNSFTDDGDTLIIFRQQSRHKSAQIKINSRTVTQKTLKDIGNQIATIVSQHEQLSLMNTAYQLELLDQRDSDIALLKSDYQQHYNDYKKKQRALQLFESEISDQAQLDFFQFQYDDIAQHNFLPDEELTLTTQKKELSQRASTQLAYNAITQNLTTAINGLHTTSSKFTQLQTASSQKLSERLQSTIHELEDISFEVSQDQHGYENNHSLSADDIENRLDLIFSYTSKYKKLSLQQLCAYRDDLAEKINFAKNKSATLLSLTEELELAQNTLKHCSDAIRNLRINAASKFKHALIPILQSLGFDHVQFDIHFEELSEFNSSGADSIEFMISINPGNELNPLAKVASGGELSRVLLAIFSLQPQSQRCQLYLFDEIDTGIGGIVANAMGKQLSIMGATQQLFCITHLAQIATVANHHMLISKHSSTSTTETHCRYLTDTEKSTELKRMVGGEAIIKTFA